MLFLIVTPPSDIIGTHTINVLCYCRSMITQLRISSLYQQKVSLLIGKIFLAQTNRESVVIATHANHRLLLSSYSFYHTFIKYYSIIR